MILQHYLRRAQDLGLSSETWAAFLFGPGKLLTGIEGGEVRDAREQKPGSERNALGICYGGASRMTAVAANLNFFGACLLAELAAIFLVSLASTRNVGTFLHVGHRVSSKHGNVIRDPLVAISRI